MMNHYNEDMRYQEYCDRELHKDLTEEEMIKVGCLKTFILIGMLLIGLFICVLLGSCTTTKYVAVPEYHTDTVRTVQMKRDSIWLHDSVFVNQWKAGDTVFSVKEKWRTQYIDRLRYDTIYKSRIDSVPSPYPVEKRVPAELSRWQSFRMTIGDIAIFLIAAIGGYIILKKIKS